MQASEAEAAGRRPQPRDLRLAASAWLGGPGPRTRSTYLSGISRFMNSGGELTRTIARLADGGRRTRGGEREVRGRG